MFILTAEQPTDAPGVEALLDAAFGGTDRINKRSYHYRWGIQPVPGLRIVARSPDALRLLGSIRYWPIGIGGDRALLLGPVGVWPPLKGKGIGRALIRRSLGMAKWSDERVVVLVGDPGYYGQFGFEAATPHGITMPGEDQARVQVLFLDPAARGAVRGTIERWADPNRPDPPAETSLADFATQP
jgi:predicted N-acetyltransferase YhbS